jgi:hypothetical protein
VTFTEEQKEMIKGFMEVNDIASAQDVILSELESQIGGLAEAYGTTFGGQLEIVKNRFGEIQETIGAALLPVLGTLMEKFVEFMPILEFWGESIAEFITNVGNSQEFEDFIDDIWNLSLAISAVITTLFQNGAGSTEFQNALNNLLPDISIDDVTAWLSGLAEIMAQAINSVDWRAVGDSFGDALMTSLETEITASASNSSLPAAIGNAISEFLLGAMGYVDWASVGQALDQAFADWAIGVGNSIDASAQGWVDDMWDGFVAGLNNLDLNAQQWVDDHIIDPIKQALGIASPSTVFMGIGQNIVLGLMAGFSGAIGSFLALVNGIVQTILAIFQPVLDVLGLGNGGTGGATGDATGSLGTGTSTGTLTGTGTTTNNYYFYGPVYASGFPGEGTYDCPSPNPFLVATGPGSVGGGAGSHTPAG